MSNPAARLDPTFRFRGWIAGGAAAGAFIEIQFVPGVDVAVDLGGLLAAIGTSGGAAIVGTARAGGAVGGVIAGKVVHFAARNPAQDRMLSGAEIRKLKKAGIDIHDLKGKENAAHRDLYKDCEGNIYVKPKGGAGPGEPTGHNINDH